MKICKTGRSWKIIGKILYAKLNFIAAGQAFRRIAYLLYKNE